MAEEKYCPVPLFTKHCLKEECAWWHVLNIQTKKGRCSLLTLAVALHWISVNPKHHTLEVKEKEEKVQCPACGRWIPMYASSCVCQLNEEE